MTLKPAWRGPVGPHMVSPEWQWAWRDLITFDLSDGALHSPLAPWLGEAAGGLSIGPAGLQEDGDGTEVRLEDAAGSPFQGGYLTTAGEFSLLFVVEAVSGADHGLSAWGLVSQFWLDNVSGDFRLGHQLDTGVSYGSSEASTPARGVYVVAVSSSPTSGTESWWAIYGAGGAVVRAPSQAFTNAGYFSQATGTNDLSISPGAQSSKQVSDGGRASFALWDRPMTGTELRALVIDPFGPIRPRLWGPELAAVGSTVSLYATADGTLTTLVDEADLTTNIYTSIDDDPATPSDSDWVNNSIGTGQGFFDLTDMPAAFGTADSAEIVVRYRGQNFGSGTVTLYAQLYQSDESTSLSNEVAVASVTGDTSFANTAAVTITGINTTANKAVWDAARVRLRWATT